MKILYRIMDIMCHPSKIGMYFKDKAYVVILHFLAFFLGCVGILCLIVFNTDCVTRSTGDGVATVICSNAKTSEVVYSNHKMSGSPTKVSYDDTYVIYYNIPVTDSYLSSNESFIVFYDTDTVSGYIARYKIFEKSYSELATDYSFTITDMQNGNIDARIDFTDFMAETLENFEMAYKLESLLGGLISLLSSYAIMMIVIFIYTYLINPTIKAGVRVKLVFYDSLIFFFIYSFAFIMNIEVFEYIAMIVPIWFAGLTFRHIIRIDKNRK